MLNKCLKLMISIGTFFAAVLSGNFIMHPDGLMMSDSTAQWHVYSMAHMPLFMTVFLVSILSLIRQHA